MKLDIAFALSDDALLVQLDVLAKADKVLTADIVAHLAALDERGLHLDLGYSSLFVYATEKLGFSDDVAYKRIRAARLARTCPQMIDYLASGELCLSSVVLLASHPGLIDDARGKTKKQVEELVSSNWPRGQLDTLKLEVNPAFLEKLELAKNMCRHQIPNGNPVEVLSKALDVLLQKQKPKKQREVFDRDERRCTFMGRDGRRCNETGFLEIDHKNPRALGGDDSLDNLRVYCRAHNQRAGEHVFGKEHMEAARKRQRRQLDLCSALRNLGFDNAQIKPVINTIPISLPIEVALKEALRELHPA